MRLANGFMQRPPGRIFSGANNVAAASYAASEDRFLITHNAGSLTATPVNSEEKPHALVLPQGIDFAGTDRGSQAAYPP
jgi:hypothetical protein